MRDAMIGASCLVVGLVVGRSPLGEPQSTSTTTLVVPVLEQRLAQPKLAETIQQKVNLAELAVQPTDRANAADELRRDHQLSDQVAELGKELDAAAVEQSSSKLVAVEEPAIEQEAVGKKVVDVESQGTGENRPIKIESLVSIIPPSSVHPTCVDGECPSSGKSLDTELMWAESPALAYEQAKTEDKLVFLIHVSGNFEIPGFT